MMIRQTVAQFGLPAGVQDSVLFWGGILIGVVLIGFFVLMFVRRRYVGEGENDKQDPGFSLAGLREMRDRGEITPEEYEAMRAKVIAKVKGTSP